jgi:hypothetical protein
MNTICTLACRASSDCPLSRVEACPARTGQPPAVLPGQETLDLEAPTR